MSTSAGDRYREKILHLFDIFLIKGGRLSGGQAKHGKSPILLIKYFVSGFFVKTSSYIIAFMCREREREYNNTIGVFLSY